MTIVVTGATGHLGRLVVDALLRDGTPASEIVAAGRSVEKLDDLAAEGVRVAQIDYTDRASLEAAFAGADVLLLVSGSEVGQRAAQHANAIDAAKAAGVGRIVYTSAPGATTSALILAPEHKATEEYLEASGIPFTILRNGWYTENYLQSARQAVESGTLASSTGAGRVASAPRSDYADAAAVVLVGSGHEGRVYELAGDYAWTHAELAEAIAEVTGAEVAFADLSPEDYAAALTSAGLDEGTVGFIVGLDSNIRDGLLEGGSGDLSGLLGRPTVPLRETLAAELA
ncbi:SDR family oxidoreductase [Antiquaquibacter soli]|uniref:SDR family oxidoreductase n=1 Tax=Antiquaquibacter soli TaxID=3064523 RepID=A0ABT9BMT4_9MICO|nr:SDR family oxidoreductase [Protaetiibacter sp. WY-16]MDO7882347.1 SDR family oxidoreductase [Protaetiibacter sp. WY-16]